MNKFWYILRLVSYIYFSVALLGHTGSQIMSAIMLFTLIVGDFIVSPVPPTQDNNQNGEK